MTPTEMRTLALKTGVKFYKIAGEVDISPARLSKHFGEYQLLPPEKAKRLEDYLINLAKFKNIPLDKI